MEKEWRILIFKGIEFTDYLVSTDGEIKSKERLAISKSFPNGRRVRERILKQQLSPNGYLTIGIYKDEVEYKGFVHDIVVMTYPDICGVWYKGCDVDHKNRNRTDNSVWNLWVTDRTGNMNNPLTLQALSDSHKGKKLPKEQVTKMVESRKKTLKENPEILEKHSQMMREKWKDESYRTNFINKMKGHEVKEETRSILAEKAREKWKDEEYRKNIIQKIKESIAENGARSGWHHTEESKHKSSLSQPTNHSVLQYSLDGEFIAEYHSLGEAERATGALRSKILMCCKGKRKTAGGFKWASKKEDD